MDRVKAHDVYELYMYSADKMMGFLRVRKGYEFGYRVQ